MDSGFGLRAALALSLADVLRGEGRTTALALQPSERLDTVDEHCLAKEVTPVKTGTTLHVTQTPLPIDPLPTYLSSFSFPPPPAPRPSRSRPGAPRPPCSRPGALRCPR